METYVALLRGINVSGQKLIKMETLRDIVGAMGFMDVQTYIQSGNIVFRTKKTDRHALQSSLERQLQEQLGFDIPVVIRTVGEMKQVIANNPFESQMNAEDGKVYVAFLHERPTSEGIESLKAFENDVDEYRVVQDEVYILCRTQFGKSLFSNNFLEKKLGVRATTRNWQTVNKLVAMGGE